KRSTLLIALSLTAIILVSCAKVVFTGRRQTKLIPSNQINSLSFQQYDSFLQENPPMTSGSDLAMVRRVGLKIQQATEKYYRANGMADQLEEFQWAFNVVDDPTVNAFCMPGGKVVVYTGILPIAQDEDGLAVIMGHEVAHALAHHGNERMSQTLGLQGALMAVEAAIAIGQGAPADTAEANRNAQTRGAIMQAAGAGAQVGVLLPFSRKHESEADEIGLYLMAIAGYNVDKAGPFWERMNSGGGDRPPEFLSTHPDPEKRSQRLRELAPKAKELAQQY
ncbi:MAG: M48 family metallopeptidase, partial [Bacteroidota bacterium]